MNTSTQSRPRCTLAPWVLLAVFAALILCCDVAQAQTGQTEPADDPPRQRDPTIPSAEIQRRARQRPDIGPTINSARPVRATPRAFTPPRLGQAGIELQSIIQSTEGRCTATLRAGNQTVTISFDREATQREVELPATQFADFASTVQQLSFELRQLRAQATLAVEDLEAADVADPESANPSVPLDNRSVEETIAEAAARAEAEMLEVEREFMRKAMQPQRIDLASSFTLDGNLYRVVDFTNNTMLLEQIPLGKFVIVR